MTGTATHFEIFGERPAYLANFYREVLGCRVEQMPGVEYWRVQMDVDEPRALHGGVTYRTIPGLTGWLLYVNVASVDETVALVESLGGRVVRPKTAVPRTAWVTIVADPEGNIFGVWQADAAAFPMPEPD